MASPPSEPHKQKVKLDPKELAVKYKRLAEDYNKISQNNTILKKALLQEQDTAKELVQTLKEKEIQIRTVEEENDLLTFNNDRLTKRVVYLQESLEEAQAPKSSGWFNWGGTKEELINSQEKVQLLTEELARANEAKVELHDQVAAIRQETDQTVELLRKKMSKVKDELEAKQLEIVDMQTIQQRVVDELTMEGNQAKNRIRELSEELQNTHQLLNEKKKEIVDLEQKHQLEMKKSRDIISRQVTFDDSKIPRLNTFNLPMFDRSIQTKLRDAVTLGLDILAELVISMCTESNTEHERILLFKKLNRAGVLDPQLVAVIDKTGEMFGEFSQHLEPVRDCFFQVAKEFREKENISDNKKKKLVNNLNLFTLYHQKLSSLKQMGLQEESKQRDCVRAVQQLNAKLHTLHGDFQNTLEKLVVSVSLLVGDQEAKPSKKEFVIVLQRLQESLQILASTRKELSSTLAAKFSKEHEDPFINPKKKVIDQNMVQAAVKTCQVFEKLSELHGSYLFALASPTPRPVRGAFLPPNSGLIFNDYDKLQNRAEKFMKIVNQQANAPSVPYVKQLEHIKLVETLQMDLLIQKQKIHKMEEEKEKLEQEKKKLTSDLSSSKDSFSEKKAQLGQVLADLAETRQKLIQITNLYNEIQKSKSQPGEGSLENLPESNNQDQDVIAESTGALVKKQNKWSMIVMDEFGNQSNSLKLSEEDRERENKLKQYYQEEYDLLKTQLLQADGKAMELYSRKLTLEEQLQQTKEERDILQSQLLHVNTRALQSTDDLESTKNNYDQQLTYLSEHVIELNEKLTRIQEELDTIKKFKVRCGKCKTWNTVEWLMMEGKNGRYCSKGNHPSSLNYA